MARITGNDKKEQLSLVYIKALIAQGKYTYSIQNLDRESIDIHIHAERSFPIIGVQLKATSVPDWRESDGALRFSLDKKNYDDLSAVERAYPAYLAVLVLPEDETEWCQLGTDKLILKNNMYWLSLEGESPIENGHKTVYLPKTNILSNEIIANWFASARSYMVRNRP